MRKAEILNVDKYSEKLKIQATPKAIFAEIQNDLYMRVMGTDSANVSEYLRLFDGIGDEKEATAPIGTISEKGDISVMLSNELALEHGRFGFMLTKKKQLATLK